MNTDASPPKGRLAFVTTRPVAITMFVLALAVFGFVSFSKLRVDLLPEISYPTLTVRTSWPGAAPEDVEQRISERIQEALSTLPNLVRSHSISRAGVSDVVLDFSWGSPMTFAVQDVREQLDGVFLPRGVERPLILRYDPNLDPILRIGIRGADESPQRSDLIHLRWMAENRVKRELEALEGVAAIQVRGGLEDEIRVLLDPYKMSGLGVDPSEIAQRLAQENINASGGSVREGSTDYLVRTLNEFENVEEIADLAVARRGEAAIRVRDLGRVERSHAEREVISRLAGHEAVEIAVYREAGANIVSLANLVQETVFGTPEQQAAAAKVEAEEESNAGSVSWGDRDDVDFMAWRYRDELDFELLSNQSTFIENAINDVKNAAVLGSIFAVGVIWLFLRRLSATVIVALAIPISVVVTFAPMYLFGASLNIMSLGGLALGVGMLVDNAIVVLESISRCREEGDDLATAAVRGTREVAGAVTASTLTTIAVFAPIVFVTGVAGQIFGDQALTVVTALIVSLIVAVFFIPMLASRRALSGEKTVAVRAEPPGRLLEGLRWNLGSWIPSILTLAGRLVLFVVGLIVRLLGALAAIVFRIGQLLTAPIAGAFNRVWNLVDRVYASMLEGALAQPWLIVGAGIVLSWAASTRVGSLGLELLPEIHQGEFTAHVKLEIGSPLETTDRVLNELDESVRRIGGVATTALTIGIEAETLSRDIEGTHTARLTVRLEEASSSADEEELIVARVRELLTEHPAVAAVEIRRPTPFALDAPVAVEVKGHDLEVITAVAADVYERLSRVEGLADLRSTVRPGHPEARITFDRDKTLEYQLDLGTVSAMVRDQVLGNVSTRFTEGDDRVDVRVMGDEDILNTVDAVLDLAVNPGAENPVPLRSVARAEIVQGPAEIRRIGNSRGVLITAESTGLDLGGLSGRIETALQDLVLPDDVFVEMGGQKREMDEAQTSMRFALLLAVFLVYVVMASQFESLLQPFVILLTVPLAGVGVVFALDWLDIPLSVVVFIGLIMLAGIVVNNAIVLVDRINQKRLQGLSMRDAVQEAGRARLRPILMTTATTALGLLPLTGWLAAVPVVGAMGSSEGAEIRAPMAIAVITGLIASTLLTLIVIPTVYTLVSRNWRGTDTRPQPSV